MFPRAGGGGPSFFEQLREWKRTQQLGDHTDDKPDSHIRAVRVPENKTESRTDHSCELGSETLPNDAARNNDSCSGQLNPSPREVNDWRDDKASIMRSDESCSDSGEDQCTDHAGEDETIQQAVGSGVDEMSSRPTEARKAKKRPRKSTGDSVQLLLSEDELLPVPSVNSIPYPTGVEEEEDTLFAEDPSFFPMLNWWREQLGSEKMPKIEVFTTEAEVENWLSEHVYRHFDIGPNLKCFHSYYLHLFPCFMCTHKKLRRPKPSVTHTSLHIPSIQDVENHNVQQPRQIVTEVPTLSESHRRDPVASRSLSGPPIRLDREVITNAEDKNCVALIHHCPSEVLFRKPRLCEKRRTQYLRDIGIMRQKKKVHPSSLYVGFDCEWNHQGRDHAVNLLQLTTGEHIALIRTSYYDAQSKHWHLNVRKMPLFRDFWRNDSITKVGDSTSEDEKRLKKEMRLSMRTVVDLRTIFDSGTAGLINRAVGFSLDKSAAEVNAARMSSWDQPQLSKEQIQYAATDVWLTLQAYEYARNASMIPNMNKVQTRVFDAHEVEQMTAENERLQDLLIQSKKSALHSPFLTAKFVFGFEILAQQELTPKRRGLSPLRRGSDRLGVSQPNTLQKPGRRQNETEAVITTPERGGAKTKSIPKPDVDLLVENTQKSCEMQGEPHTRGRSGRRRVRVLQSHFVRASLLQANLLDSTQCFVPQTKAGESNVTDVDFSGDKAEKHAYTKMEKERIDRERVEKVEVKTVRLLQINDGGYAHEGGTETCETAEKEPNPSQTMRKQTPTEQSRPQRALTPSRADAESVNESLMRHNSTTLIQKPLHDEAECFKEDEPIEIFGTQLNRRAPEFVPAAYMMHCQHPWQTLTPQPPPLRVPPAPFYVPPTPFPAQHVLPAPVLNTAQDRHKPAATSWVGRRLSYAARTPNLLELLRQVSEKATIKSTAGCGDQTIWDNGTWGRANKRTSGCAKMRTAGTNTSLDAHPMSQARTRGSAHAIPRDNDSSVSVHHPRGRDCTNEKTSSPVTMETGTQTSLEAGAPASQSDVDSDTTRRAIKDARRLYKKFRGGETFSSSSESPVSASRSGPFSSRLMTTSRSAASRPTASRPGKSPPSSSWSRPMYASQSSRQSNSSSPSTHRSSDDSRPNRSSRAERESRRNAHTSRAPANAQASERRKQADSPRERKQTQSRRSSIHTDSSISRTSRSSDSESNGASTAGSNRYAAKHQQERSCSREDILGLTTQHGLQDSSPPRLCQAISPNVERNRSLPHNRGTSRGHIHTRHPNWRERTGDIPRGETSGAVVGDNQQNSQSTTGQWREDRWRPRADQSRRRWWGRNPWRTQSAAQVSSPVLGMKPQETDRGYMKTR